MTDAEQSTSRRTDAAALERAHCRRCRYALRGLRATSPCPECGLPIGLSLGSPVPVVLSPAETDAVRGIARLSLGALAVHVAAHLLSTSPLAVGLPFFVAATLLSLLALARCRTLWRASDRARRSGMLHAWGGCNLLLLLFAGAFFLAILTTRALLGPAAG